MKLVVIDYGSGNLESVFNAFRILGQDVKVSSSPAEIRNAAKLVLPGVGSFQDSVSELNRRKLIKPITDYIRSGKLFFGMCLGLQLLFESSEEGPGRGLSVFKGKVRLFKRADVGKIPHMGWNSVNLSGKKMPKVMKGIENSSYFYFVHSYYADPVDVNDATGITQYGKKRFCSMVARDNIVATQFHPEKSQVVGLKLVRNFTEMKG